MPEFFLEIGAEEIPAGYVEPALEHLRSQLTSFFEKGRIPVGESRVLATPRRLALSFADVAERQDDAVETHLGPNVKVAFDSDGAPTKAAIGFARGKGLDVGQLTRHQTDKGEVVCARLEIQGRPTAEVLNEYLPGLIAGIPFPKKMRWGSRSLSFARPMHWVIALLGGEMLDFEVDGISCRSRSSGHRFLKPETFPVTGVHDYLDGCESHYVMVDPERRRASIRKQIHDLAKKAGGQVPEDEELLDEVAYLVEYPFALLCDFEEKYLELPRELLVMTMRHHQRYFPLDDGKGELLPNFITVCNVKPGEPIKNGNERVLRARLEDARFFYDEDRKRKLEDFVDRLKGVVFQKKLGTSYEKMERFSALAKSIAEQVCPAEAEKVQRAARLCKADLETQMVYEFPELQGIIGGYYARHSGEDPEVAVAIQEHYRPAFAGDLPPSSVVGAVVALADKMDTILGIIGVGLIPTGSEDPYGLRRHSLGMIQILLDRGWQISLDGLIDRGLELLGDKVRLDPADVRKHVHDLFVQRLKSHFDQQEIPYDAVDAVLATGIDSIVDVSGKVTAFADLKKQPHFEPLATAFRRVVSILTEDARGEVRPDLLQEPAEKALFEAYQKIRGPVEAHMEAKEFDKALEAIAGIKPEVDGFFDAVMVMVDDADLRKNRMHLLYGVSRLFERLADFSRIVLKKS